MASFNRSVDSSIPGKLFGSMIVTLKSSLKVDLRTTSFVP